MTNKTNIMGTDSTGTAQSKASDRKDMDVRVNELQRAVSDLIRGREKLADLVGELSYDYPEVKLILNDRTICPDTSWDLARDILAQIAKERGVYGEEIHPGDNGAGSTE